MNDDIGKTTSKSDLSQVVVNVRHNDVSMNEFIAIYHINLDRLVLCQVADIKYKEKKGIPTLLATLNILERIPNPFPPRQEIERAKNGTVSKVLNIIDNPNHINIGKLIGHDINVCLNPNGMILNHIAVLGMTNSGKTYTVCVILEEMIRLGITGVIIDPHGDYSYMGKFYPDDIIVKEPEYSECLKVESLYHKSKLTILNLLNKPEIDQDLYVNDIGYTLFRSAKQGEIDPFLFVVDECHNFAPQNGSAVSKEMMARISGEGRKFGMGLCVITQRPARINKNVLSQCNTQIILKVSNPNDIKAVYNSVEGVRSEDKKKIQALQQGQALIIGSNIKMPQYVQIKKKICGDVEGKKVI